MQILITHPERFVQYKENIGIILFNSDDNPRVNLFTGNQHFVIKRNEIESPLMIDLNEKLTTDESFRDLAFEHDLIEKQWSHHDRKSYLTYYSSFN